MRPLADCLYALRETIPPLSRPALHRLFPRHGIRQLPVEPLPPKAARKPFNAYGIGYFHLDFTEVRTAEGKQ